MGSFVIGFVIYFVLRCVVSGFYSVDQNERAVVTTFGKAARRGDAMTSSLPIAEMLTIEEKQRYDFPVLDVIQPGGPYFKFPWQKVHKVSVATQTVSIAFDPESVTANSNGTMLDAVTKDQLNTGLQGQLRFTVSESNLYAFLFGVRNPIAHVMGYLVSILRERIANFEPAHSEVARKAASDAAEADGVAIDAIEGISINDLRKNLNELNIHMERECRPSVARYGIHLNAALITSIDPPHEVEAALAAINTAHNSVSAEISLARASADQKIVQSRKAVEIETLKAQAEVQMLEQLSEQLSALKDAGGGALRFYVRNLRLALLAKAKRIVLEVRQ